MPLYAFALSWRLTPAPITPPSSSIVGARSRRNPRILFTNWIRLLLLSAVQQILCSQFTQAKYRSLPICFDPVVRRQSPASATRFFSFICNKVVCKSLTANYRRVMEGCWLVWDGLGSRLTRVGVLCSRMYRQVAVSSLHHEAHKNTSLQQSGCKAMLQLASYGKYNHFCSMFVGGATWCRPHQHVVIHCCNLPFGSQALYY